MICHMSTIYQTSQPSKQQTRDAQTSPLYEDKWIGLWSSTCRGVRLGRLSREGRGSAGRRIRILPLRRLVLFARRVLALVLEKLKAETNLRFQSVDTLYSTKKRRVHKVSKTARAHGATLEIARELGEASWRW
jgi:hypothetical protein